MPDETKPRKPVLAPEVPEDLPAKVDDRSIVGQVHELTAREQLLRQWPLMDIERR